MCAILTENRERFGRWQTSNSVWNIWKKPTRRCVCRTAETAQNVVESVQLAFEDELDRLAYEDSPHVDLFHDVTYAFFREKE